MAEEVIQERPKGLGAKPKPLELGGDERTKWRAWKASFKRYAKTVQWSALPPEEQVAVFMSHLGPAVTDIYEGFALTDAQESDLEVVKARFDEHFDAKENPAYAYESHVFNTMVQEDGEKMVDYISRLQTQLQRCQFVETGEELRKRLLRDRLIAGVRSESLRTELLKDKKLTATKTIQMCEAFEQAVGHSEQMESAAEARVSKPSDQAEVNAMTKKRGKPGQSGGSGVEVRDGAEGGESDIKSVDSLNIFSIRGRDCAEYWTETIQHQGQCFKVHIDTGAECSVMSAKTAARLGVRKIERSSVRVLATYSGHKIDVKGYALLPCMVRGVKCELRFQVIDQNAATILDGKSAEKVGLIKRINNMAIDSGVFDGLGKLKDFEYDIDIVENPKFVIHPARSIPFRAREAVKRELDNMVKLDVIEKCLEATDAVSPLVVVRRKGKIRICVDLTDVNVNVKRRHFPLVSLEEIATRLEGSKVFTLLDCFKGFWQIVLTKKSSRICTFSTPWGRYSCKRLPFGLASAPELFQQIMSNLLGDMSNVEVSMDDILIHAKDEDTLKTITEEVIKRLNDSHVVTSEGLRVCPEKVEAIERISPPKNKEDLHTFLGMVTYLAKFIPNLSQLNEPLRQLGKMDAVYRWEAEHQESFQAIKKKLIEAPLLHYFKICKPVVLSVDSSSKAYGAVLLQDDWPVAYASRSLSDAESNYPQIEKEAGAVRFGCQKFHNYIWGAPLTIETDHKPLETIFRRPLVDAPPRLKRILYDVKPYAPTVVYKKGKDIPVADALSRICSPTVEVNEELRDEMEVCAFTCLEQSAEERYRTATADDEVLSSVLEYVRKGWPDSEQEVKRSVREYFSFREQLSIIDGLLFKGEKIVIPETERANVLKAIHEGHCGVQASIRRAREFVFWPGMAAAIKYYVEKCKTCLETQPAKQKEELLLKKVPEYPFQIVASDLFHYGGKEYVVLADSFSGFFEFRCLKYTSSEAVVAFLKEQFAAYGCPETLETDGGPQYSSKTFSDFAKQWGFRHEMSSPRYPRANGLAERYVQIAKKMLKRCQRNGEDVRHALLMARNTPRESLGSPAERLMGRKTRNGLCAAKKLVTPETAATVSSRIETERHQQKKYADRGAQKFKDLSEGQRVMMQNPDGTWSSGGVKARKGPHSYIVALDDGRELWRNSHFLKPTNSTSVIIPDDYRTPVQMPERSLLQNPQHEPETLNWPTEQPQAPPGSPAIRETPNSPPAQPDISVQNRSPPTEHPRPSTSVSGVPEGGRGEGPYITRSGRVVKKPDRLDL